MTDQQVTNYEADLKAANEIVYKHSLELARLKQALETANAQQENLLHFISHEIKGYLTKAMAAFAEISDRDVPADIKTMSSTALGEMRKGVATVMDILDAANLKKGTVAFHKQPFDLKAAVIASADALKIAAEEKHLALNVSTGDGDFTFEGDEEKIKAHVLRNLIDNSVRYTKEGSITVELARKDNDLLFTVRDTGVGITDEDKARLFTEGGHGKDSITVNVHSTGYGLFIAKQIVESHGGKIWAESEGAGKGSAFFAQFPAHNK